MQYNTHKLYKNQHIYQKHIPPNGAGTLEEAGCVCAEAPTGTVPKTLLKTNTERVFYFFKATVICLEGGHKMWKQV